jgi:hypothetical protein
MLDEGYFSENLDNKHPLTQPFVSTSKGHSFRSFCSIDLSLLAPPVSRHGDSDMPNGMVVAELDA